MFGKLNTKSLPIDEPIVVFVLFLISLTLIFISCVITYKKRWTWIWREWITSVDHKKIGIMYIITAFVMFFRGFSDACMMRCHQMISSSGKNGFLPPSHYDQIFTVHGVIMIFFVATPLVIGIMNLIVPLQIGTKDMAFPVLNSISLWLLISGAILVNLSLVFGEFARTGWLAYPPLSEKEYSPGVGVDYWIWSLQISGISTTLTGINFLSTILYMRASGMSLMKMPVFSWTSLCSSVLIIFSFPVLSATVFLLSLDRYLDMHFFTNDMGGNMMMYVNLIWAWGHPEVYILILPAFGIFSEVTATFCKKSLFGYTSLVWATVFITFMSFCVWLHHFFTMGNSPNVNAFFGIATMIISIPTGVKVFNWLFTMYHGKIQFYSPMLWTIGFIVSFSVGGMAGMLLAIPSINYVLHNSLFLIAHFHNVIIGGVIFGCFAGITYWFPKAFGFLLNEKWGICSFFCWIVGFFFSFMPLYVLGFKGMTRRLSQNIENEYHFFLSIAAFGTFLIFLGIFSQVIQIVVSFLQREKNIDRNGDPWDGRTLEWSVLSPAPYYNFSTDFKVRTLDAWWNIKQKGEIFKKVKEPIFLPKNSSFGFFLSFFVLIFSFCMVWYIWWLAILSLLCIFFFVFKEIVSIDTGFLIFPVHEIVYLKGKL